MLRGNLSYIDSIRQSFYEYSHQIYINDDVSHGNSFFFKKANIGRLICIINIPNTLLLQPAREGVSLLYEVTKTIAIAVYSLAKIILYPLEKPALNLYDRLSEKYKWTLFSKETLKMLEKEIALGKNFGHLFFNICMLIVSPVLTAFVIGLLTVDAIRNVAGIVFPEHARSHRLKKSIRESLEALDIQGYGTKEAVEAAYSELEPAIRGNKTLEELLKTYRDALKERTLFNTYDIKLTKEDVDSCRDERLKAFLQMKLDNQWDEEKWKAKIEADVNRAYSEYQKTRPHNNRDKKLTPVQQALATLGLNIHRKPTSQEIDRARRQASFKVHPDQNQGEKAAEEKQKKINNARDFLRIHYRYN